MSCQAFLKELTLPLMQRNLIGAGRDPIPKRLVNTGHGYFAQPLNQTG